MKSSFIREVTLYRYRYVLGYIAFGILLAGLLAFGIEQVPRGLTNDEMASAVTSVNVNPLHPTATNVIDAPYHHVQKLSIQLFGLTPLAIKLPSILIGAATGVALIFMLRRWFRTNVAIITALIVVTSVGFLSMARTGSPIIMPTFWTVILLLAATYMLHADSYRFIWKLFSLGSLAMLAYSPLGIYPCIALAIAGLLHPHVRNRLRQGKWWKNLIIAIITLGILAPLIIACINTPRVALQLLGFEGVDFAWSDVGSSLWTLGGQLFNFTTNHTGPIVTPLFNIATTILLLLGLLKLFTARYSARSYMLFIWLALLVPVLILRPDALLLIIVPSTLVLAIGIESLIRQWYDLFPRNPYARIGALLPLSVLVFSITGMNVSRYFLGHQYGSSSSFHAELPAVRETLENKKLGKDKPVALVVPPQQVAFYDLMRRQYPRASVSSQLSSSANSQIILASSTEQRKDTPSQIVTNDSASEQALLLRVYTQ